MMLLLSSDFTAEGTGGLNFCAHSDMLINEVDKLSHKIRDNK